MKRDWNSIMFDDIGMKIQKAAKIVAWSNIVMSIVGGIVLFFFAFFDTDLWYLIFLAPIAAAFGCVMAWLSVITVYGFGKLIDDVEAIRNQKPPVIKIEAEPTKQSVPKANQNSVKKEKTVSLKPSEISSNNTNDSTKKEHKEKEEPPKHITLP